MFKYRRIRIWEKVTTVIMIIMACIIGLESDREKPKPYPVGNGDTLMIRITGYEFCPSYCEIDHFHVGHFKKYNCEEELCIHITINQD